MSEEKGSEHTEVREERRHSVASVAGIEEVDSLIESGFFDRQFRVVS